MVDEVFSKEIGADGGCFLEKPYLVFGCSFFRQSHDRVHAHSEMVATNEVKFRLLDKLPYLRLLKVVDLVAICSRKLRT